MPPIIFKRFIDILPDKTAHGAGNKYVFLKKEDALSNMTQVAIGILTKTDFIELHVHETMEEYYYFLEGNATFIIGCHTFECNPNTFVKVPSNTYHKLNTFSSVKFLYWGVAI